MFTTGYRRVVAVVAAAVVLAAPTAAYARPAPNDDTGVVQNTPSQGRTDQQFWGEATYENPSSGLNLDRSPTTLNTALSDRV